MKHIVTLSLVFFSLTHLAKAEQRVEGLRILSERYCNKQQTVITVTQDANQLNDDNHPFLLSSSELTLIGMSPDVKVVKYEILHQLITDLAIRKIPNNNSP
jgi:hypothetical protein